MGDLVLDVLVRPERQLVHATDVRGAVELLPGGSAANFAVWAARLAAHVSFAGAVGTDWVGEHLIEDLRREGVESSGIVRIEGRSPVVFAWIGPDGERTMVTDRRVTLQYGPGHLPPNALVHTQHLHLTAYSLFDPLPAAAARKAARRAREVGASLSLDLSSAALLVEHGADRAWREIEEMRPQVLFGNADECLALSMSSELHDAAVQLATLAPAVVVKRGPEGCLLATSGETLSCPAPAARVVDTTGAGDAFDAAWVCAWLRGAGYAEACREASRLAARVVELPGARCPAHLPHETKERDP